MRELTAQKQAVKHFLDTSVVIPLFLGTSVAKGEYRRLLPGKKYVSPYVSLEFHGACLRRLIEAYFLIAMPQVTTVSDGIRCVAQHFGSRQLKMDIYAAGILADLASARGLSTSDPSDKAALLEALSEYVLRLASLFRRVLTNIGLDNARCARAAIMLRREFDGQESALREFATTFDEWQACRSKCAIDRFFLERRKHRDSVGKLCTEGTSYPKAKYGDFVGIRAKLQAILADKRGPQSCKKCSALGDAIIALDVPDGYEIVHIDRSFNALCEILDKQHSQLPSVMRATKDAPPGG